MLSIIIFLSLTHSQFWECASSNFCVNGSINQLSIEAEKNVLITSIVHVQGILNLKQSSSGH